MRRLSTSTRTLASRLGFSARPGVAILVGLAVVIVGAGLVWIARPWDPLRTETVQDGLEHPWDIAFAADGRMLVTERIGRVRVYASGEPGAELLHTADIADVRAELESGLMGIAVLDDTVFVCASRDPGGDGGDPWRVDLMRASLAGDGSLSVFERVAIGPTTGGPRHQGCAVEVDADEQLWVSIGDANQPAGANRTQDPVHLNGKILRLNPDGTPAEGSPFESPVYSLGHRNPQGIAIRSDGFVIAAEHGTDTNDELNVIVPGGNYGYPCVTGAGDPGPITDGCGPARDYIAPAWASGSPTLATSGATFLIGQQWGEWEGDLVVSTLKEEDLRRFSVSPDGEVTFEQTLLDGRFGRLRAVVIGPDGALYVSTTNGPGDRVIRVTR
jgi:glucose/arabinose dehydrogenase